MQQVGLVVSDEMYRKIAQKAGDAELFCWKCGKARQCTAAELEKLMRHWPTCRNCKEKIHIRAK
jgi:hypothetical protein